MRHIFVCALFFLFFCYIIAIAKKKEKKKMYVDVLGN